MTGISDKLRIETLHSHVRGYECNGVPGLNPHLDEGVSEVLYTLCPMHHS